MRSCRSVGIPKAWLSHGISAFAAARSPPPADWQSSFTALSTFRRFSDEGVGYDRPGSELLELAAMCPLRCG